MQKNATQSVSWLNVMDEYVLQRVLPSECSKVKILHGNPASGKSNLLRELMKQASQMNYINVYMDLHHNEYKLTDLAALYRTIAATISENAIVSNLQSKIYETFGYQADDLKQYDGNMLRLFVEKELEIFPSAQKRLRSQINAMVKELDISFSHQIFMSRLLEDLASGNTQNCALLFSWLRGEKLSRAEKVQLNLFETMKKANARIWLYSLNEILTFAGFSGILLIWDHFEAVYNHEKSSIRYTKAARNDVYELLRQIIDDIDVLPHFLLLLASDNDFLQNEKFGAQSYHALWMRIVPTTKHRQIVNPYADIMPISQVKTGEMHG
jgi:hypothetical protein